MRSPWRKVLLLLISCTTAYAQNQSAEEAANIAKTLSSQSQTTIQRLSSLDSLPAEGWKTHVGDLAHGEAVDMDDSRWPIARPNTGGVADAVWYRRSITVPPTLNGYDLTGARIWFSLYADSDGPLPEIIYLNGRRVAMGDDLEPIVLFDRAKPGVKLLPTVDKKIFQGTEQKIEFSESRPNPNDVRVEFLTAVSLFPSLSANVPADTATLDTLPPREFRAGYAEVVKYGLLGDAAFFSWLETDWREVFKGGPAREHAIAICCRAKAAIVARDERETGDRQLLNLGHTFGHALEAATGFSGRLLHGEAVAAGMALAFEFSARRGLLPAAEADRAIRHLADVGLPARPQDIPGELPSVDRLLDLMAQDKKIKRGMPTFILVRGIGAAFVDTGVDASDVRAFLDKKLAKQ